MDKRDVLRRMGCLNRYAERVKSPLFKGHDFFNPYDKLQVRYEMLRAVKVDGMSITQAAEEFGYSRETYYTVEENFRLEGTVGLMDTQQGRRQPEKLVDEVVAFIVTERRKNPRKNSGKVLANKVKDLFKIDLHRRTIYKALKKTAKG
jgi:transposase